MHPRATPPRHGYMIHLYLQHHSRKTRAASTFLASFPHHVLFHVHIDLPSGQELPLHTHSNGTIRVGYTDVAQNLLLFVNLSSDEWPDVSFSVTVVHLPV